MSDRADAYIREWVRDNPTVITDDGAAVTEALCADARRLGMGLAEFEEAVGDVPRFLSEQMAHRMSDEGRAQLERGATDV